MKPLDKHEIFENLSGFLKARGIELKKGSYASGIQKSCELLTHAVNLGQEGFEKAKDQLDKNLEQMRQIIHEKTAPKTKAAAPPPVPKAAAAKPKARSGTKPRKKRRS